MSATRLRVEWLYGRDAPLVGVSRQRAVDRGVETIGKTFKPRFCGAVFSPD